MQTVLSRSASKAFVAQAAPKAAARPSVALRASAEQTEGAIFDPKGDGYACECAGAAGLLLVLPHSNTLQLACSPAPPASSLCTACARWNLPAQRHQHPPSSLPAPASTA